MASINVLLSLTDRFTSPLRSVANTTRQVQRQIGSANNTLSKFGEGIGSRISGITSAIGSLASAMGALSIGAYALDAVNTYKDFDQSMHNLAATAGITASESNEAYASMMSKARELGATTTKTASEAANAMNYMCLAGWNTEDVLANVGGVLKLSEATGMDLAAASDAVTDSMAALGLTANDTGKYLDVVAKAQQKSNQGAAQLLEAYKGVGGLMNNLKVPIEESATALGVLANRGIKGAEGGTALNAILANLTTGAGQAGKAMAGLGLSAFNSDGSFKGIQATLMELQGKLAGMTDEEKNATLAAIGGKEHVDALNDLMAGLTTTVADGRTEWNALTDDLKTATGALDGMAATQRDTLQGAMDGFRSALEDTQITLVSAFAPALKDILNTMSSSVLPAFGNELKYFGETILPAVISNMDILGPIIAGVVGGFAAFAIITEVAALMTTLTTVIEGVSAAGGVLNFVMMANPFFLYAAAIGAVIAAVALLWNKCEGFRNVVTSVWESIKSVVSGAIAAVSNELAYLSGLWDSVGEGSDGLLDTFTGIFDSVLSVVDNFISPIADVLGGMWGTFSEKLSGLGDLLSAIAEKAMNAFTEAFAPFVEIAGTLFSGIVAALGGIANGIMAILTPVVAFVADVLVAGITAEFIILSSTLSGFINGVATAVGGVITALTGIVDFVSGVLAGDWEQAWTGINEFATGIFNMMTGTLLGTMQGLAEGITTVLTSIVEFISGTFTSMWQSAWDNVSNIFSSVISGITGIFDGFINGITSGLDSLISKAASAVGITAQGHATGTSYFRGGLTSVNEHGGELMNLPSGTQIIPHDLSEKMVSEAVKPLMVEFAPVIAPTYDMEPRNVFTGGNERYLDTVGVANSAVVGGSSTTTNNETYNKNYNEPITVNLTVQGNVIGNEDFMNQCGRYITDTLKTSLANM